MEPVLYDKIGYGYNTTRQADPFIAGMFLNSVFFEKPGIYLDIGCGTGNYTTALAGEGFTMHGVDPSEKMLETAKSRNSNILWKTGSAEAIPAPNNIYSGIMGMLTLHHWNNYNKAFKELYRVLKPGGKMTFFTSAPEQMQGYWLNHYFPKMMEHSIAQMPSYETIYDAAAKAGFTVMETVKYFVMDDLQDCFLYIGKNEPLRYFDENIRKGISSFASLSYAGEVEKGLALLRDDIQSGNFIQTKEYYMSQMGDYLFITFTK